jgi:Holliday junction resolvase RusA-like endonuclease
MKTITIEMPYIGGNLSVNSYRYSGKKGQSYLIKSSVKGWMIELIKKAEEFKSEDLILPLVVTVNGKFSNKLREPDLDNLGKVICDSLKVGLKIDDKFFRYRSGKIEYGYTNPILEIVIREGGD